MFKWIENLTGKRNWFALDIKYKIRYKIQKQCQ